VEQPLKLAAGVVVADRFRLERPLGQGGMGAVWRAQHVGLHIPCALKFIHAHAAASAEVRERFEREARGAAQIRSPNVVQILDHGVWEGTPYIAMELLEGEDLSQRLKRQGMLDFPEVVSIVSQVARALGRAEAAGLVHRDLKPANIFLVRDDDREIAKVLDFGVAKSLTPAGLGEARTETGTLLGTPYYMSPEQAQGTRALDHRSDLWSLAVITFQCLTGELPFRSEALGDLLMKIMMAPLPVPSEVAPLPPELDAWWARAAARDPAQRFQSAKELAEALALALGVTRDRGDAAVDTAPRVPPTARSAPALPADSPSLLTDRPGGPAVSMVSKPAAAEAPRAALAAPDKAPVLNTAPSVNTAPSINTAPAPLGISQGAVASISAPLVSPVEAPRPASKLPLLLGGLLALGGVGAIAFAAGMARSPERDAATPSSPGKATATVAAEQPRPSAAGVPAPVSAALPALPATPGARPTAAAVIATPQAKSPAVAAPAVTGTNLSVGAGCSAASQCQSGFCVDAVCCDSACTDRCMACTAAKKHSGGGPGYCGFISGGEDPDRECGAGKKCDGMGTCIAMSKEQIKALTGP
jgi:serine/threonine-protein kinase